MGNCANKDEKPPAKKEIDNSILDQRQRPRKKRVRITDEQTKQEANALPVDVRKGPDVGRTKIHQDLPQPAPVNVPTVLDIPTVQFPVSKTVPTEDPFYETDRQTIPGSQPITYGMSYIPVDTFELAPKIRRNHIAPMSHEDWVKQGDRERITIVEANPVKHGTGTKPWYS